MKFKVAQGAEIYLCAISGENLLEILESVCFSIFYMKVCICVHKCGKVCISA